MARRHFTPALFAFLEDLAEHNERPWFKANKARYEDEVREPAIAFIMDFAALLRDISPHFRADPRKSGGSLFRIYRDVRFSKDKRPYKTHTGIQFRHEASVSAHAPGFYLHLEPGGCFVGAGIWRPDSGTLRAIREHMVDDPAAWRAASGDPGFRERFERRGDRLKRMPKGFDGDHELAEDLKYKDHIGVLEIDDDEVTSAGFIDVFAGHCRAGSPFVAWLCRAIDVPF